MQCPNCGKTSKITINDKVYCSNCGLPYPDSAAQPASVTPVVSGNGTQLTDIAAPTTATPASASPIDAPSNAPNLPNVDPVAAGRSAVLDLRGAAVPMSAPVAGPVTPPTPALSDDPAPLANTPAATTQTGTDLPVTAPGQPEPISAPATAPVASSPPPSRMEQRLNIAATTPKSESITKFPRVTDIQPSPTISPVNAPIPTAAPVTTPSTPTDPTPPLPEGVAKQLEAVQPPTLVLADATPPTAPLADHDQAFAQAMAVPTTDTPPTAPSLKPLAVVGAAVLVLGMGSYIWLQNAPKLAVKNASALAGFAASLPGYIPSSYSLSGPVSYATGQVSVKYSSPGIPTPLTITQKRTDWNASSLLDNYVSQQSDKYVSVEGQGLTIYISGASVTWVNHGVWFLISGTEKLSQDQILRLVYSL